ncbi:MAG: hypothetical protein IPH93_13475 [Saprospiraceae bacterium]|nr:hypothetical protein [Saprospiraceae bacterium]MBK7810871.1 hypothetical protein [Saprospiraceae bacterium]MBK9630471.1 hypothetical protein [Saprospiraceae bacterium]
MIGQTLDLIISMVTIILLASLLFGSLYEWYASYTNSRGKFLRDALAKLFESNNAGQLIGQIYSHPSIHLLSKKKELPSYIPDRNFAQAVLDVVLSNYQNSQTTYTYNSGQAITSSSAGLTGVDLLKAAVTNMEDSPLKTVLTSPAFIDPEKINMDELSKELMIWYQHYGERTNGWYKRKVQSHLIGWTMLFCIIFNFNPIAIYKEMKQNTALREATIQVAEKMVADSLNSPGKKNYQEWLGSIKELQQEELPFGYTFSNNLQARWESANLWTGLGVVWDMIGEIYRDHLSLSNFIGWLIGGLLLTVQSGFWFDLLAKILNIRKGGIKPEPSPETQN